ncbi:hypothetical protein [Halarcobacter ebronensis]|uniref:Uncharacterized protein n=1 Tax=Halarcobacter ebronensis TaxID=1462615 RepID=A0A4Q1ASF2_9BACT|nr:hypothetical protein [Halarcobacter ebronensis]QKF81104.1 hypothetical protein AEBR_0596 [Halarcobacter ebronensis]RXK06408.1 hypothetical protein CRV07_06870 [Halarcobacter ebronensis]
MKCNLSLIMLKILFYSGMLHFVNNLFSRLTYMKFIRFFNLCRKNGLGRKYLELEIMPKYYPSSKNEKILLIGSMKYNLHYSYFYLNNDVYIIEPNNKEEKCSGRAFFINDYIENIDKYIQNNFIDIIQFNGVYGWGLNESDKLIEAIDKIYNVMNNDAILIFGHNSKTNNPLNISDKYDYFFNKYKQESNEILPKIEFNNVDQIYIGFKKK